MKEEGGTVLSGYGVQLAVKNSEYKAVDDTKVEGEQYSMWSRSCSEMFGVCYSGEAEVEEEEEVEMDIQGFSFPTLQSVIP